MTAGLVLDLYMQADNKNEAIDLIKSLDLVPTYHHAQFEAVTLARSLFNVGDKVVFAHRVDGDVYNAHTGLTHIGTNVGKVVAFNERGGLYGGDRYPLTLLRNDGYQDHYSISCVIKVEDYLKQKLFMKFNSQEDSINANALLNYDYSFEVNGVWYRQLLTPSKYYSLNSNNDCEDNNVVAWFEALQEARITFEEVSDPRPLYQK